MVLSTHAIVGASIASIMPSHPVLGFAAGFFSHFLLDSIPHRDYRLLSSKRDPANPMNDDMIINKNFIIDLIKIGSDALLGLLAVLLLFGMPDSSVAFAPFWGAIGGMAPDALQFVYFKWRHEPIVSLQRFHLMAHSKKELGGGPIFGILSQVAIVIFCVAISKIIF